MAGRPRKTETKNENKEVEIKEVKDTSKQSVSFEEMMTPENIMKMFTMFKQMENMQQETVKETKVIKEKQEYPKKFTKAMLAKISDETVIVRSTTDNVTFISPKTKIEYNWLTKGDVEPLPIVEILAMENASKRFLHTPWLVVEDERVIDALDLKRTYDLIKKVENVDELIKLSKDEISKIFNELPSQYKNNFRNEIFKKVKSRELNNLSTIDSLSEILHIDLKNI